jgi:hypothetical protein
MFSLELHTELSVKFWDTENYVHVEHKVVRRKANRLWDFFLYFERFEEESNESIKSIAIGNWTWKHHFRPQEKEAGVQWKYLSCARAQKFKAYLSVGKNERQVILNGDGVIHTEHRPRGTAINKNAYWGTVRRMCVCVCVCVWGS